MLKPHDRTFIRLDKTPERVGRTYGWSGRQCRRAVMNVELFVTHAIDQSDMVLLSL